jgi:hypothetical protein
MVALDEEAHRLEAVLRVDASEGRVSSTVSNIAPVPTPLPGGHQLVVGEAEELVTLGGLDAQGAPSTRVELTHLDRPGRATAYFPTNPPGEVLAATVDAHGRLLVIDLVEGVTARLLRMDFGDLTSTVVTTWEAQPGSASRSPASPMDGPPCSLGPRAGRVDSVDVPSERRATGAARRRARRERRGRALG